MALDNSTKHERNVLDEQSVFNRLRPLEQAILIILAHDISPSGKDTIAALAAILMMTATLGNVRTALDRMGKASILSNPP